MKLGLHGFLNLQSTDYIFTGDLNDCTTWKYGDEFEHARCDKIFAANTTGGAADWCCQEKAKLNDCYVLLDDYCIEQDKDYTKLMTGVGESEIEFKYEHCFELNPNWPHDHGYWKNFQNRAAVGWSFTGMLCMIFVASTHCLVKDKTKVLTSHPSGTIAKIAVMQAFLYFLTISLNYPTLCMASGIVMEKSQILPPLLKWIPLKKWFFYK